MKIIKAFTLAETLITIAIIGVVAALVIPTTIAKINRLQVETALPIAYQNLKQIITAAEQEEGPMEEWAIRTREEAKKESFVTDFVENYFLPYVQGAKYEYTTAKKLGYKNGIHYAHDTKQDAFTTKAPIMILPNGMIVFFLMVKTNRVFQILMPKVAMIMSKHRQMV